MPSILFETAKFMANGLAGVARQHKFSAKYTKNRQLAAKRLPENGKSALIFLK
ncbi:hypothetical protein [Eikenella sp. HMSC073A11]|uniref:hypothetical protein n=1 Tax=Eikenella sp. HMSC073A11 TaxID=1739535 RepID=UPI000B0AB5F3|nr:hypothetical protein [Eikenella sp. HMSC073A11]